MTLSEPGHLPKLHHCVLYFSAWERAAGSLPPSFICSCSLNMCGASARKQALCQEVPGWEGGGGRDRQVNRQRDDL